MTTRRKQRVAPETRIPEVSSFSGANALDPDHMTPEQRRREIGAILARGAVRFALACRHAVPGRTRVVAAPPE